MLALIFFANREHERNKPKFRFISWNNSSTKTNIMKKLKNIKLRFYFHLFFILIFIYFRL